MALSIIYPVHITFGSRFILKRMALCLKNTSAGLPEAEHVIVLSGNAYYLWRARRILNNLNINLRVLEFKNPPNPYSPGIARNFGVNQCSGDQLLFWDIDLLGSPQLFNAIPQHCITIQKQKNAFEMYACIYLTEVYSKRFNGDFAQLWQDATTLKVNTLEHFALATSTILCNKQHFIDIGEFDEAFIGHMGEDLELLNRLAVNYLRYPIEADHCENKPSKNPAELGGFRKHFARYSIPHLEEKLFTAHIYHNTRTGGTYRKPSRNLNRLLTNIDQKNKSHTRKPAINLPCYLETHPIIEKTGHQKIKNKIRKLIRNPKKFVSDIQKHHKK